MVLVGDIADIWGVVASASVVGAASEGASVVRAAADGS